MQADVGFKREDRTPSRRVAIQLEPDQKQRAPRVLRRLEAQNHAWASGSSPGRVAKIFKGGTSRDVAPSAFYAEPHLHRLDRSRQRSAAAACSPNSSPHRSCVGRTAPTPSRCRRAPAQIPFSISPVRPLSSQVTSGHLSGFPFNGPCVGLSRVMQLPVECIPSTSRNESASTPGRIALGLASCRRRSV